MEFPRKNFTRILSCKFRARNYLASERAGGDMLSVLMILLAAALPQRGALRHIIRTAPLRPPAPRAARARPAMVPTPRRTGPRFLKDARFMAAFTGSRRT